MVVLSRPSLLTLTPVDHMLLKMFSDPSTDHMFPLSFLDVSQPDGLPLIDKDISHVEVTALSLPTHGEPRLSPFLNIFTLAQPQPWLIF